MYNTILRYLLQFWAPFEHVIVHMHWLKGEMFSWTAARGLLYCRLLVALADASMSSVVEASVLNMFRMVVLYTWVCSKTEDTPRSCYFNREHDDKPVDLAGIHCIILGQPRIRTVCPCRLQRSWVSSPRRQRLESVAKQHYSQSQQYATVLYRFYTYHIVYSTI